MCHFERFDCRTPPAVQYRRSLRSFMGHPLVFFHYNHFDLRLDCRKAGFDFNASCVGRLCWTTSLLQYMGSHKTLLMPVHQHVLRQNPTRTTKGDTSLPFLFAPRNDPILIATDVMRLVITTVTAVASLGYIFPFVEAPPPVRPFQELGEALHGVESVSTELTLGRPWGSTPRHPAAEAHGSTQDDSGWSLPPVQSHLSPSYVALETTASSSSSPHHGPSLPASAIPEISLPSSPRPADIVATVQETSTTNRVTRLDTHFSHLITDPQKGLMRLPSIQTFIRAPWLSDIFRNMLDDFIGLPWKRHREIEMSDADAAFVLTSRNRFFRDNVRVYRLHIQAGQWGATEARELLVRHHGKLLIGGRRVRSVITAWATADQGRCLALLGIYASSSMPSFERFLDFVGVDTFVQTPLLVHRWIHETYLVPEQASRASLAED